MKKRILTVLVSLAAALALLPTAALAEYTGGITSGGGDGSSSDPSSSGDSAIVGAEEVKAGTWEELIAAIEGDANSIKLMTDLSRETDKDAITIGRDLTIDLGGYTLNGGGQDSVIVVKNEGDLTIQDSSNAGNGKITGGQAENGGGIHVEIAGNTATVSGGGIYVAGGTVIIGEDVQISNNTAKNGGGTVTIGEDVKITKNSAAGGEDALSGLGGGIYVAGEAILQGNAEVSGNNALTEGGGIYVRGGGKATIEGKVKITGNIAGGGGGVYAGGNELTIKGEVTITGNSAKGNGGGIHVGDGTVTMQDDVAIGQNSATGNGGGIYLTSSYTFTMAGGSITGNRAGGEDSEGTPSGMGGGVANKNGTFQMTGGKLHQNTAGAAANDFYNILINGAISGTFSLCQAEEYSWYLDGPGNRYSEEDPTDLYPIQQNDSGEKHLTAVTRSFTITVTAGAGGSIAPDGTVTVEQGGSREFTIVPEAGYRISDVKINGESIGPQSSYTFENVQGDQTISVTFALNSTPGGGGGSSSGGSSSYTVTPGRTENGSVSVSPSRASYGRTVTVTVEAEEGYELEALTVTDRNGEAVELTRVSDTEYTFAMPRSRVTVEAAFAEIDHADVCPGRVYADLDPDAWYHAAVDYVIENGMMDGVGGGLFAPGSSLNRAMMAQVLWNLEGNPEASAAAEYGDVASDAWYHDAVQWATAEGIVDGYGGVYGPEDDITREQMALMLYRYARYMGCGTAQGGMEIREFSDYEAISDWALEAMTWAVNAGVLNGRGGGVLDPAGHAIRAEAAQILMNFRENAAK